MGTAEKAARLSWLDRFLIGIAPRWGMRRLRARAAAAAFTAAGGGRRGAHWYRTSSDANSSNGPSMVALRELSRDLRRNNGWARRGIQVIANNTVGWGIGAKAEGDGPLDRAMALWKLWSESPRCDWDGRMSFAGLQSLVMQTVVESGECLVVNQPADSSDGLAIPLRLQVLEPDYLDSARDLTAGESGPIVQGIEFDERGRRVAYWLHSQHPGSARSMITRLDSRRVPAERVLHIYRMERPGQSRGIPWLASAIARLNDFDDYEDAELMLRKISACLGVFVTDVDGTAVGEQDPNDPVTETLEPGEIRYLPPGKKIETVQPPAVADLAFTARALRRIAASLGVTYEDLTGDYSQVNFSSARMARLAHWGNVYEWRYHMLIPQLCDGVWRWAMELAAVLEDWTARPAASWSPPPMPMLEPDKEGLAYQRMVRNGFMTWPQVIRELGEDPARQLAELAETNDALDEAEIVLDCDPRMTNAQGAAQQAGGGAASGGGADPPPTPPESPE